MPWVLQSVKSRRDPFGFTVMYIIRTVLISADGIMMERLLILPYWWTKRGSISIPVLPRRDGYMSKEIWSMTAAM